MSVLANVVEAARSRPVSLVEEAFEQRPYELFELLCAGARFAGRKREVRVDCGGSHRTMKCALTTGEMLLGLYEGAEVHEAGVTLAFRPLLPAEAEQVIAAATGDLRSELRHPFRRLGDPAARLARSESRHPVAYWTPNAELVSRLAAEEHVLRQYTRRVLRRLGIVRGIVFDPACSTGTFLRSIKMAFPDITTLGQDVSEAMVAHARPFVDVVHHGDALVPGVPENSVDIVFCRFLNVTVVTTEEARERFDAVARCCRRGGHVILFGHTPVILSGPWFEQRGFAIEQAIGATESGDAVFQYYVLRRL